MAKVLTTNSKVDCGHGGVVNTTSTSKLKVDGQSVLLANEFPNWSISLTCSQKGSNQKQCSKISSISNGRSTKLKVNGIEVLLDTLSGITNGVPKFSDLSAEANQDKLNAV